MANEIVTKALNTRIALKIDTLQNWESSTIGLLNGEIAIATVAATAGTGLQEPVCMIKIGEDGVKTFSQLDWNLYAKASDVISACKSEEGLTAFVNSIITGSGLAKASDLEALTTRVTTAEGKVDDNAKALETLNGDSETEGSVAKSIVDAIEALDLENTYVLKTAYDEHITAMNGELDKKVDKVEGKGLSTNDLTDELKANYDNAYTHSQQEHAPADAQKNIIETVKVNGTALEVDGDKAVNVVIPEQEDYTVSMEEDITDSTIAKRYIFKQCGEEIGRIDLAKELVVSSGTVGEVTEADAPYAGAVVGDKYIELVIANQDEHIFIPAKDLVDIYTAAADATEVQVSISGTNEISATLVEGGVAKTKLAEDVQTSLGKADTALQESDIEDLVADQHTHDNKDLLDTYTQTEENLADAVAKKHAHENATVLDAINADKVAAWDAAEGNAKAYADEMLEAAKAYADENDTDTTYTAAEKGGLKLEGTEFSIDDSLLFILDCGTASSNISTFTLEENGAGGQTANIG